MKEFTEIPGEASTVIRGCMPESGWLRAIRVESEHKAPHWLLRVTRLVIDGREIFQRGPSDSMGLSMFEGAGYQVRPFHVSTGAPIELFVTNPGRVPFRIRLAPVVRSGSTTAEPVSEFLRRWT